MQVYFFYNITFWFLTVLTIFLYFFFDDKKAFYFYNKRRKSYTPKSRCSSQNLSLSSSISRRNLLRRYLIIYSFASLGDWLQGPYLYVLYQSYGYTRSDIQILFVVGFSSSMLVGTIIGSFADIYGRKLNCMVYFLFYSASCLIIHIPEFKILVLGRILGGAATSILMTAFESWLVKQHALESEEEANSSVLAGVGFSPAQRDYDDSTNDNLKNIFSYSTASNSIMAILAGLLSQFLSDKFGPTTVFDFSAVILLVGLVCCYFLWFENYGNKLETASRQFKNAFLIMKSDRKVLVLGLIQALFEAAMYCFVLEWTPSLSHDLESPAQQVQPQELPEKIASQINSTKNLNNSASPPPYGIIFSCFMLCITIGSWIYKQQLRKISSISKTPGFESSSLIGPVSQEKQPTAGLGFSSTEKYEMNHLLEFEDAVSAQTNTTNYNINDLKTINSTNNLLLKVLIVSLFCLLIPTISNSTILRFLSFCVFEINIGIFWPCLATLRSKFIPENVRATLMNIFRIPLNLMVIIILLPNLSVTVIFRIASFLVTVAGILQYKFMTIN